MTVTQVLGAKVQPTFADPTEWNSTRIYAPLTIVLHEGNSFTSKQYVPVGIDITNTDFWAETGNYNAQVEQYRQEVLGYIGKVANISNTYLTVADMKADTSLKIGDVAQTLGFYTQNDTGNGTYIVSKSTSNGFDKILLDNGLTAELIVSDYVSIVSLGAKADSSYDCAPIFNRLHSICVDRNLGMEIHVPQGRWYTSPVTFTFPEGIKITGETIQMEFHENVQNCTMVSPMTAGQSHIFCIGQNAKNNTITPLQMCKNYLLNGFSFVGCDVNDSVVILALSESCEFDNLSFTGISNGYCVRIIPSWECRFGSMYFRQIGSEKPCVYFDSIVDYSVKGVSLNQSALYFDYLSFENLNPTAIETAEKSWIADCQFNVIEAEWSAHGSATLYTEPIGNEKLTYILAGYFLNTSVNQMNIDTGSTLYYTYNGLNYKKEGIITHDISETPYTDAFYRHFTLSVGTINMRSTKHYVVSSHNANTAMCLTIGNLIVQNPHYINAYNGMVVKIGAMAVPTQQLNTLMPVLKPSESIALHPHGLALTSVDDSIDVTGCALEASASSRYMNYPYNNIKILAKIVDVNGDEVVNNIVATYFDSSSGSSTGFTTIQVTSGALTEYNITLKDKFFTLRPADGSNRLLIYFLEFSNASV